MLAALVGLALAVPVITEKPSDAEIQKLGFSPVRLQALRDRMAQFVREKKLHGVVTLIERHGRLVSLDAFGSRQAGGTDPIRTDDLFLVMSMTKPVTAVAVAILAEQGKLRFSDPVENYLPAMGKLRLADGTVPKAKITLRHLLNHTSGLASDTPVEDSVRASMTLAQFVEVIEKQPLRSEPGTETRYSGVGTTVAGRLVELASGKPFEKFCEDAIFKPLHMANSRFFLRPEDAPRLSGVSIREEGRLKPFAVDFLTPHARFANPAGGLISNARDMAQFQRDMLEKEPKLLSRAMIRYMTTPSPRTPGGSEDMGYGVGWSVVRGPVPARGLLPPGAFGHTGAFGTYAWSDPENDLVGVFMTQCVGNLDPELETFRTMVYAALLEGR